MRLLANENLPRCVVEALRADGHDVAWVWEDLRGSSDSKILARAQIESRIVVTFDKDFGALAFRFGLPATSGVLLFRIVGPPLAQVRLVREALTERADWTGVFAVISNEIVRVRQLP